VVSGGVHEGGHEAVETRRVRRDIGVVRDGAGLALRDDADVGVVEDAGVVVDCRVLDEGAVVLQVLESLGEAAEVVGGWVFFTDRSP
jgi:hypothetical protein